MARPAVALDSRSTVICGAPSAPAPSRTNRCPRYGGPFDSRYSSLTEWRAFYCRLFAKYLLLLSNRRQPQLRDREGDERGVGAQRADLDRGHVGQRPREVFGGLAVGGEKV